VFKILQL